MTKPQPTRSDGEATRERLLLQALRLFSEHGFAKTSTRDIASAAGANIAAISYYFGDKKGLYRAAFQEPMGCPADDIPHFAPESLTLEQALTNLYVQFLAPLKMGEVMQQCLKLHYREMVEPTGAWEEEIQNGIVPYQAALVQVLMRHFGKTEADDELYRLSFSIVGLAVFVFMARDVIDTVRPSVLAGSQAIDELAAHFTRNALAMVHAQAAHFQNQRTTPNAPTAQAATQKALA
jgi:TetR/AcrR family transcriptional regulator, regulator of cefoperazone and chloramphenicol sensitivity